MDNAASAQNSGITSDEQIRTVLRRHIQKAYDRGDFTRPALARESAVNIHQIDQIMSGSREKHRRIAGEDMFNLAYTLGEDAVAALVGTIHYTASRPKPDSMNPAMLVAKVLPHVGTIAVAAVDGIIDHVEQPTCQYAADQIIAAMLPLSSAAAA